MSQTKNIVLVHGGFVDGSGWESVYNILKKDGYTVAIVQNPTISLADDVAATKRIIDAQTDPVVLVGHSYGGAVITEAGNDPKVAGLVYITALRKVRASPRSEFQVSPKSCQTLTLMRGITRLTRQVAHADALHGTHSRVECRDDRSAFFAYYQITNQIKAVNVSCARLIEHRAVAAERNAQRVREVGRGCASQREYHSV
jgi:pimeloyl-ACP methyl ester carboxylesterase